jgi:hypothetical protein
LQGGFDWEGAASRGKCLGGRLHRDTQSLCGRPPGAKGGRRASGGGGLGLRRGIACAGVRFARRWRSAGQTWREKTSRETRVAPGCGVA